MNPSNAPNVKRSRGGLPLCWQGRLQKAGEFESTVLGPYTYTNARRVAEIAKLRGDRATLEEIPAATRAHRAIIARKKR